MRFFALTFLFLGVSFTLHAQIVSLSSSEVNKLKMLIKEDDQAKAIYLAFKKTTASYLDQIPNPVDTIRTEGLLKGNPIKVKTQLALADMNKMYALALEYRLNKDRSYLEKSTEYLLSWAKKNRPNGDPIDDTNIDKAVEAYDLIKTQISSPQNAEIKKWLSETAWAEINSKRMKPGRATAINNWNAHRLKVVGEIGYCLNDPQLINWTIENLKSHIAINLNPDGTSLDFKERDAMHYHIYDLEPLLKLSIIIQRAKGEDFYSYDSVKGSSIKKSVEWLYPYLKGEKQHEEYVNTTVKFDRDRAKNNEPGFAKGTLFDPRLAMGVIELSSYFDPQQKQFIDKFQTNNSMQELINKIKGKSQTK